MLVQQMSAMRTATAASEQRVGCLLWAVLESRSRDATADAVTPPTAAMSPGN